MRTFFCRENGRAAHTPRSISFGKMSIKAHEKYANMDRHSIAAIHFVIPEKYLIIQRAINVKFAEVRAYD